MSFTSSKKTSSLLPVATLTAGLALAPAASAQFAIGTGDVQGVYNNYCATCHGQNLEGGQGSSLVDDVWKHGSTDAEIAATIRNGIPDLGMVPWKDTLSEEQIRSLVIFIRENALKAKTAGIEQKLAPDANGTFQSEEHAFHMEKVFETEGVIWAMEFLPDSSILATERSGTLWHFKDGKKTAITGTPKVWANGQGGLLEVQKHPDYDQNGWIYLGYSESIENGKGITAISRGRIRDGKWTDQEQIFRAPKEFHTSAGHHFGTRFVFKDGYLFFSIGDRGQQHLAQDLTRPNGKIHRIHDDGRIPADNPFRDTPDAFPTTWSYGHRNPQGLDLHPVTGEIWEVEHGPRGGDETNLIERGKNYGWPTITYGMNYNGTPITNLTEKEGMEQPKHYWVPSIAICGIDFYTGDKFPAWKNNLFVSGMASQELHRLVIEDGQVTHDEIVFKNQGRIRDVYSAPDGHLYVALIQQSAGTAAIYRLVPN